MKIAKKKNFQARIADERKKKKENKKASGDANYNDLN